MNNFKAEKTIVGRWNSFWFEACSWESFSIFRVCHTLTLLFFLIHWWQYAPEWIGVHGYHLPSEVFKPLPDAFLPLFAIVQFGSLVLLIAGRIVRFSAAVSWICLFWVTSIDRLAAFSINNIYLFTLAVIVVYPGTRLSKFQISVTGVRILQVSMVAIYFSAGWNKAVFGDWLDSPNVLQSLMQGIYMTDLASWAVIYCPSNLWSAVQYGVLCFELFSPILFFTKSTRPYAIVIGIAFHLGIALFMHKLTFFSLQMMSFYILFLPPLFFPKFRSALGSLIDRFLISFNAN